MIRNNYSNYGSNVPIGPITVIWSKRIMFIIFLQIFCRKGVPVELSMEVTWGRVSSQVPLCLGHNAAICSFFSCFWGFLPPGVSVVSEMRAHWGSGQVKVQLWRKLYSCFSSMFLRQGLVIEFLVSSSGQLRRFCASQKSFHCHQQSFIITILFLAAQHVHDIITHIYPHTSSFPPLWCIFIISFWRLTFGLYL